MRIGLKTRFSYFLALSILSISAVSALLFSWFFRAAAEKEITARGQALVQSLSRAAAPGLAAEDLDLLNQAADIVHTEDLLFAQVFSANWSPVDAHPFSQLRQPPDAGAVAHFRGDPSPLSVRGGERFDFYAQVQFRIPQAPETTIGYVRLALSARPLQTSLRRIVLGCVLLGALLGAAFVVAAQIVIGKTVVAPILGLHQDIERFHSGEPPEARPAVADDEIADLTRGFREMSLALRERETRLRDEKERLAVTLRSIGDGVIVTGTDAKILLMNRVAEELTGWSSEQAAGRPFCEVFDVRLNQSAEHCESMVALVLTTDAIVTLPGNTTLLRRDGTAFAIEDSAAPIHDRDSQIIGVVLVFRDVTGKRRLEEEAAKAEKVRALGVLAGGIAHDFNNLLTGVMGNVSLARAQLAPGERAQVRLEQAEAATQRAAELAAQLLAFSKGGAPVRGVADLGAVLEESARFALSGTNVKARFRIDPGTWPASVDAGQVSQVFNNLAINASQAMPRGGTVEFSVVNAIVAAGEVPALASGDYLLVTVRDDGPGIASENLPKIFDPYFTTKAGGSGLGLTSAYWIVMRHGGRIDVESNPDMGTTFRIWLPAARGAAAPSAPPVEAAAADGHGAILVMDDEAAVREVAAEILRTLGYEPFLTRDGREALAAYRRMLAKGRPFRAVVMDLTIPGGMGGRETVAELLALDPGARAIVSSGYSNDPTMAEYRRHGFRGVIVKPYSAKTFAKVLREVLDQA